jgi:hypothetical protein
MAPALAQVPVQGLHGADAYGHGAVTRPGPPRTLPRDVHKPLAQVDVFHGESASPWRMGLTGISAGQ